MQGLWVDSHLDRQTSGGKGFPLAWVFITCSCDHTSFGVENQEQFTDQIKLQRQIRPTYKWTTSPFSLMLINSASGLRRSAHTSSDVTSAAVRDWLQLAELLQGLSDTASLELGVDSIMHAWQAEKADACLCVYKVKASKLRPHP